MSIELANAERLIKHYEDIIKCRENEIAVLKQVNADLYYKLQKQKNKKKFLFF